MARDQRPPGAGPALRPAAPADTSREDSRLDRSSDLTDAEAPPALPAASLAAGAAAQAVATSSIPGHDSYREIWALSWPVMLGQVLVNAVSLIDIAMVGRLGSGALAAVGYAAQFFFLVQSVLFAVGFACVALMARSIGAEDPDGARRALAASLEVAVVTAFALVGAILVSPHTLLGWLGAPPEIAERTVPYLVLLLGSSILLSLAMTFESGLRADRDPRTPMWIALVVTVVKVALNLVLIFGAAGFPRLELVGAGIATAVSQTVGVALFVTVVIRALPGSALALRLADFGQALPLLRPVIRLALPGVGERLAMNLALLAYFRILAEYGPVAIATYTVGIRILSFSWIPGTGFGTAAATLVGQALGAGEPDAATRAGWRATRLAIGVALLLGAVCAGAREELSGLFTRDPELIAELGPFLLCLALTQPFLQSHFTLGGAHRGAGDTFTPFMAALVGNWVMRVPLAVLFAYGLHLSIVWVWYALSVDHLTRTAWLAWSFRRLRWRRPAA